jgi:predicted RNA-binding protein with RPS1 domain
MSKDDALGKAIDELLVIAKEANGLREKWAELHSNPEKFSLSVNFSEEEKKELERKSSEFKAKRDALFKELERSTEKLKEKGDEIRKLGKELRTP